MAGFAAAPWLDHVVLIHKNLSPTGGTKIVASKSESSCPPLSASSAARTFQSRLHRKPDPRNLSLFKAVCKTPMMRSGQHLSERRKRRDIGNHETTVNLAFFFVQNNLRGKDSGYWKWQVHQTTPGLCSRQIPKRDCLIRCGRRCGRNLVEG